MAEPTRFCRQPEPQTDTQQTSVRHPTGVPHGKHLQLGRDRDRGVTLVAVDCVDVPAVLSPVGTQGGNSIHNPSAGCYRICRGALAAERVAAVALAHELQTEIRVLAAVRRAFLYGSERSCCHRVCGTAEVTAAVVVVVAALVCELLPNRSCQIAPQQQQQQQQQQQRRRRQDKRIRIAEGTEGQG